MAQHNTSDEYSLLKVYLSGPMTGLPNWNHDAFNAAAKKIRDKGYLVFNPAEIDNGSTDKPRSFYMKADLHELMKCDYLVLLPGWEKSKGARLEVAIAEELEMPIFDENFRDIPKETICQEADRIVSCDRGDDYGHPRKDFSRTGRIWGAILSNWAKDTKGEEPVPPELVGLCMVGLKISREVHKPKRDNRVDGAGYFKTVDMIHDH